MKVSDIIRIGDKIDIRVLQEVEQAEKTDVIVKTYKSKVLDFCSNGNMEIAMPMEAGKLVLLQLGVRYELVFFSRESLPWHLPPTPEYTGHKCPVPWFLADYVRRCW